jgi:hypothetical protein
VNRHRVPFEANTGAYIGSRATILDYPEVVLRTQPSEGASQTASC